MLTFQYQSCLEAVELLSNLELKDFVINTYQFREAVAQGHLESKNFYFS